MNHNLTEQHTAADTPTDKATVSDKHTGLSWFTRGLGAVALSRSWWRRWVYPLLFLLTLTLSLATYLTLDTIQQAVNTYVNDNQRALVGGDLILESNQHWPEEVISQIQTVPDGQVVYDYQFNAMLVTEDQTLLGRIKGVTDAYPLYGEVELASGKSLSEQLRADSVVVAPEVLRRLNVAVGDRISIGEAQFIISDELIKEPDRPLTAFGFGGRVMMQKDALEATHLIGQRSRVSYQIEVAGDPELMARLRAQLMPVLVNYPDIVLSDPDGEETAVSRISNNVLMFLKLLVIAVLLLSAVAMYGVITAFVTKQQSNDAIRMALGETTRSIKRSYYRLLFTMAVLACIAMVSLSFVLLNIGQPYLTAILPSDLGFTISPVSVIKTMAIAFVLTQVITHRSLYALDGTKPMALLNHSTGHSARRLSRQQRLPVRYGALFIGLYAFLTYEVQSLRLGAQVLIGWLVLIAVFWALARGWLKLLARVATSDKISWMQRIASHNLARKGNQSTLFFVTLSLSVAVLTLITTINHSINEQFITAYPEDAPNLFLLDVQTEQHDEINRIVQAPVTYYPVIRARIVTADGVASKDIEASGGDDPTRVFNLSYAETVMDTEFIVQSQTASALYAPIQNQDPSTSTLSQVQPLSILDTAASMLGVGMGDRIGFNIQGIELVGEITSIRSRFERGPSPFFYFLFEPAVLSAAPQIQFATAHVPADNIPKLQGELVRQFPAVTSIDGTIIAEQVQELVAQMSRLVYLFTLLALLTGLMVLISSLLSTSQDRMKESASFRLLGMQKRDLYVLNILELALLGMSAASFAVVLASMGAWLAITQWFNLHFSVPWARLSIGALILVVLLFAIAIVYVRLVIGRGIMARVRALV